MGNRNKQTAAAQTTRTKQSGVREHRAGVAAQDRQWREQGQAEQGGSDEGWGLDR